MPRAPHRLLVGLALVGATLAACDPTCDDAAAADAGGGDASLSHMPLAPYEGELAGYDAGDLTVYADGSDAGLDAGGDAGADVSGDAGGAGSDAGGDAGADAGPVEEPLPECTDSQELTNDLIDGGMVLEEGSCWLVNEHLFMRNGTLDVRRGVRIAFAAGIRFLVETTGRLKISGTAVNPVTFVAQDPDMPWQGLSLRDSDSADNLWKHLILRDAGEGFWTGAAYSNGAVFLDGTTVVEMSDITFERSRSHGLIALGEVKMSLVDATFDGNDTPAYLHPNTVAGLGGELTFVDNTNRYVRVTFGNNDAVVDAGTWPALAVPYRIEDRTWIDAPLTLAPGTVLEVARGAALHVNPTGALTAVGTAADPIVFRGVVAGTRGAWKGIEIASTEGATSAGYGAVFDHCVLEDGGGAAWTGGVDTESTVMMYTASSARFTHTTFRNSAKYALWASENASLAGFADNTFEGSARVMLLYPDRIGELAGTSTISGNDEDIIDCARDNNDGVNVDATWKDLGVPYRSLSRLYTAAHLTLEAGVRIEFPMDQGLTVEQTGSLSALGTAAEPVVLTGGSAIATGSWLGVRFLSPQAANTLTHTNLTYTGSSFWTGSVESDVAIFLESDAGVSLSDVMLGPGSGYGIYLSTGSTVSCANVTFSTMDGAIYDFPNTQVLSACP